MAFSFPWSKKGVPDLGQEETEESDSKEEMDGLEDSVDFGEDMSKKGGKKRKASISKKNVGQKGSEIYDLEVQKLGAKLESIDSLIKSYSERFSSIGERLGEVRNMTINNEKSISRSVAASSKAAEIVKEVKPEKLRSDYQKLDMKIKALSEKLESNKEISDTIYEEIKDLRRKSDVFVGTDGILKLNEEVKKDLVEIKKLDSKVRLNADKSEQLFIQFRKGLSEVEKSNEIVSNLDESYSGLKEEIEALKVDHSDVVGKDEFSDFKKKLNSKFSIIEQYLKEIDLLKQRNTRMSVYIEKTLAISKKNEEDIADLAMTIGDDHIKRVSDYDSQIASILGIIDNIAGQISKIKEKVGIKTKKIKVTKKDSDVIGEDDLNLKNLDVHPALSSKLIPKKSEIVDKLAKFGKKGDDSFDLDKLDKVKEDDSAEKKSILNIEDDDFLDDDSDVEEENVEDDDSDVEEEVFSKKKSGVKKKAFGQKKKKKKKVLKKEKFVEDDDSLDDDSDVEEDNSEDEEPEEVIVDDKDAESFTSKYLKKV